ncbi:hypothetical protein [Thermoflexus sp.]|uniref:hypothetical protein n=1 Tax=Thermoflexus sp. TaxID=1969742 RepID=UPI002ADDE1C7|nr:hypothetical protein [Thermoflexus sp.]
MTTVAATAIIAAAAVQVIAITLAALLGGLRRARNDRHDRGTWEIVPASRRWI